MSISGLKALQISKMADHILHVPGNYRGGNLEMTIVISSRLDVVSLKENIKAIVDALKRSNEVFRNVRLNLVRAKTEGGFENNVVPLIFLQTGKIFEETMTTASLSEICSYLLICYYCKSCSYCFCACYCSICFRSTTKCVSILSRVCGWRCGNASISYR